MKKTTRIINKMSAPHNYVAELWFADIRLGELYKDKDSFHLEIYPHPETTSWHLAVDDLLALLTQAKKELNLKIDTE